MTKAERDAYRRRWTLAYHEELRAEVRRVLDLRAHLKATRAPSLADAIDRLTELAKIHQARDERPLVCGAEVVAVDRYGELWITRIGPQPKTPPPAREAAKPRHDPVAWRERADAILAARDAILARGARLTIPALAIEAGVRSRDLVRATVRSLARRGHDFDALELAAVRHGRAVPATPDQEPRSC